MTETHVTPDPGTIMVRRTGYGMAPQEREERVPVPAFEGETARVRVSSSVTRRMEREFEFQKIEIMVDLPCVPNQQDLSETVAFATGFIETIMHGTDVERIPPRPRRIPGTPIA